ncbi:MAG: hypothetical protein HY527_16380 [Betaproteobacteria bacterium]|nr:hypothetical protein [Betaproteobacteria bacterium]
MAAAGKNGRGETGAASTEYGPWNPGIQSELPSELLPLSTIFRPENVFTNVASVDELRDLTGLDLEELVVFRPERLVVHELLIRVTADLSVPDGSRVEDLGINFRQMTQTILARYVEPHMPEIVAAYDALKRALSDAVGAELTAAFGAPAAAQGAASTHAGRKSALRDFLRPFRRGNNVQPRSEDEWDRGNRVLREWAAKAQSSETPLSNAAYGALIRVVSAVRAKHGRMWGDTTLLARLAVGIACNEHSSEVIGQLIEPYIRQAAQEEGYRLLPSQEQPVVMNTKGASASGKSTMRPLQKKLAGEIGVRWGDFALISPDIWRKYLLDYGTLGDAYKYAGTFTGRELAIIDHKLDRYMARKAERGGMSHLLIDRFRFDSFAPDSDEAGSNLLTRFGHLVYMFFMITPPHETVERSWKRGLEVGRYKAVDDLLAHNIEAFSGVPELFFTWALRENKRVHYEFLDNSVPFGERPRTIAFGWNGEMNVLDVKSMLDIDRYRKINVNATAPHEVYPDGHAMAPENNTRFLAQCVRMLPIVNFADRDTGRIYARLESGKLVWTDPEILTTALEDAETRAGVLAVAPAILTDTGSAGAPQRRAGQAVRADRFHTLGQWGQSKHGSETAMSP